MRICFLLAGAAGLLICVPVLSQPVTVWQSNLVESLLESIESRQGEMADFETLLQEMENLQRHPINLNTSTPEELRKLIFLTDFQISSLADYRTEHGNLVSVNELNVVYGFNEETIRMMLPFVTVDYTGLIGQVKRDSLAKAVHHEIVLRTQHVFEEAEGYRDSGSVPVNPRYPGSSWLYYCRYSFETTSRLSGGVTAENDPGEEFFNGSNSRGFDFYSGYLRVNGQGVLKDVIVGDFRLQFGQGLTLWSGSAPGKSVLSMNIVRRSEGIKPYTSSDENGLFRGVAATAMSGKFSFSLFFSSAYRDANITDTLSSGRICFSAFQETGYHRTPNETTDEKSVHEYAYGGNLRYRNNWLKVGTTWVNYELGKYQEKGDEPKDVFAFEGTRLLNWGIDYTATCKKWQLFGETSHGYNGWATLNGLLYNLNKYASLCLLYRNFRPAFFSMHAGAFSEGSSNNNEEAFYTGTILHPFPHWQVSAYADFYRFPWLKYRIDAPSSGSDYLMEIDYSAGRKTDMFLRLHYEENPKNESDPALVLPMVISVRRTDIRYHISWELNSRIKLQERIEMVWIKPGDNPLNSGVVFYQDIGYKPSTLPIAFDFRFAWFNTDSYDSRIYAYEQDLSTGFSFSPLYNRGYRTYAMIRYDVARALSLRVRLSRTNYTNMDTISSGMDLINGSAKTEIKLQLTARF